MLMTVKEAAFAMGLDFHNVYYLLTMGEIEAVKIGDLWRLAPESVDEYAKRLPEIKNRKPPGYFIYPGDGGFLFGFPQDRLPPDPQGEASGMERRRGQLVRGQKRSPEVLLQKLKPVGQMELFAG
jgi:excisionase family DNA binding protein